MTTINKITDTRIEVIETKEERQEYEKVTLEEMKKEKLKEIADIDELLSNFK